MKPTRVCAAGTFQHLHPGHVDFLRQAKALGTELVVIIARDARVRDLKNYTPDSEDRRRDAVEQVPYVDQAVLGSATNPYDRIAELKPDVIALGYDQRHFVEHLKTEMHSRGLAPKIVRLKPFHPEAYKSSILTNR